MDFNTCHKIVMARIIGNDRLINEGVYPFMEIYYLESPGSDIEIAMKKISKKEETYLTLSIMKKLNKDDFYFIYNKYKNLIPEDILNNKEFIKLAINNI